MSYFVPWNSYKNYQIAKAHGFHDLTHEWDRTHHAENFDQIDSRAYLVHSWLKYPKFGHAAATDYTARYIRYGMMTREEAIPIIKARDGKLDPLCVRDFCDFCGYTETEFWAIMDKFYNRDLFEKNEYDEWQLKHPIWEETSNGTPCHFVETEGYARRRKAAVKAGIRKGWRAWPVRSPVCWKSMSTPTPCPALPTLT